VSTVETDVLVSYILFPHVRDGLFPSLSLVGVADGVVVLTGVMS